MLPHVGTTTEVEFVKQDQPLLISPVPCNDVYNDEHVDQPVVDCNPVEIPFELDPSV